MHLVEHSTLGPYRLERPDTAGTAFRSWRARRIATGEAMRITFPSPPSGSDAISSAEADGIERSLRHVGEVALAGVPAALAHWADGLFFVASPVPAGRCLADMIKQGSPERLEERLGIAALLANLMASAHENGIAHGQLSPEMIYVHPEGRVTVLECGIHPMLSGNQERAVRADICALGRILYRYFAGEWPESGGAAAQARNLARLPATLPRSMAQKIAAAASDSAAEVPTARNLAIHLALDKAWVKAMSASSNPEVPPMQDDPTTKVRVTISDELVDEELTAVHSRRFPAADVEAPAARGARPIAALSPSPEARGGSSRSLMRTFALAAIASTVLVGGASTLVLRPRAAAHAPAAPRFAVPYAPQPAAPARTTYAVRVGPYREPRAALAAHVRLRNLGFEPVLIYGKGGAYLRPLTTAEEPEAIKIARGLQQEGFIAIVTETGPDTGLLKAVDAAEPRYRTDGVLVDFEGGQSKGCEAGGSAVSMRNSSLFAYTGEHSLEVALRSATSDSPGILRLMPESVVLPQDRFVAHVLQPTAASGRLGATFYIVDARGTSFSNPTPLLEPGKWMELQLVVSQHAALPIQEVRLQFSTPLTPWTGTVYVDHVEQQRPR